MTEFAFTASCPVAVAYHTFDLSDDGTSRPAALDWSNGLVSSQPGQVTFWTGIHTGTVHVRVDVRRHPPTKVDADAWDEVVEHSVISVTGTMRLASVMNTAPDMPALTPFGPGSYRLRVHARGRDTAPDGAPSEVVENYLFIIWPSEQAPDCIHKHTDQVGADLRAAVPISRPAPAPPEPHSKDDSVRRRMNDRLRRPHNGYSNRAGEALPGQA
jgi:hypothetical protein